MHPEEIAINDYTYALPEEKIAAYPLSERDASKLLIYKKGGITESRYSDIVDHLPNKCLLVFNDTSVIPARILFQKATGGFIEIFCLESYETFKEYSSILQTRDKLRCKCMIGGAGKWKNGILQKSKVVDNRHISITAQLLEKLSDAYVVQLSWQPATLSFAEIIEEMGDTPLPPYIKRKAEEADKERYQTVYAKNKGSVAAPTAGLHFTTSMFSSFVSKGINSCHITLHVGAGTFKPVKAFLMKGHEMHAEWIDVNTVTIKTLIESISHGVVAVGTTSVRTLESLYWMGVKTILTPSISLKELGIKQWEVYDAPLANAEISPMLALSGLAKWMLHFNMKQLIVATSILIAPSYSYKIPVAIITNFHQPQSTLLLLVAAAIGHDWKKVYSYAMENNFRFLSYGDGSLLYLPVLNQLNA